MCWDNSTLLHRNTIFLACYLILYRERERVCCYQLIFLNVFRFPSVVIWSCSLQSLSSNISNEVVVYGFAIVIVIIVALLQRWNDDNFLVDNVGVALLPVFLLPAVRIEISCGDGMMMIFCDSLFWRRDGMIIVYQQTMLPLPSFPLFFSLLSVQTYHADGMMMIFCGRRYCYYTPPVRPSTISSHEGIESRDKYSL